MDHAMCILPNCIVDFLSLATRFAGGNAINRRAPFQDLWKASKKKSKWLCDRKNKHYEHHEKMMLYSGGTRVRRLPNETRVAGVLLLLQDLICSFHTTCEHSCKNPNFKSLVSPPCSMSAISWI